MLRSAARLSMNHLTMNFYNMSSEHWIFIPSVFMLGLLIGFLLGVSKGKA